MASPPRLPIVLGISGASAQPLALRALQLLLEAGETVDLVVSRGAILVWMAELGIKVPADPEAQHQFWREQTGTQAGTLRCHRWSDQAAAIASGSHRTAGMVILPCSMGAVGRMASGVATDLLERAADVHLKEGRPLVICPRELPWTWCTCATSPPWRRPGRASLRPCPPGTTGPPASTRWWTFW